MTCGNNKKLSLYIHIPFCLSKCEYCDFFSITPKAGIFNGCKSIPDSYVDALCSEILYRVGKYCPNSLNSVYIGGGTPSLLDKNQLKKICDTIFLCKDFFCDDEPFEFTIEVNPDDVTKELLESFEENGINRISCGIQSCTDSCLQFVNRRAKRKENLKAMEIISRYWKGKKSFDLICGLPYERKESFKESLELLMSFNPDHISMYSLTIEDQTPLGRKCNSGQLDYDFNFADELWLESKVFLEKNGYCQYEVSNFCKPGCECIHNLVYWNHEDYLGCGSGASGTLYDCDGRAFRWTNTTDVQKYIDFWCEDFASLYKKTDLNVCAREVVDCQTSIFEYFMMGLRKTAGISEKDFFYKFKRKIPQQIIGLFEKWQKKGLADIICQNDEKRYFLTKDGLLFLNRFLEEIN